jgi:predicted MFS family arabinose efflux permease
MFINSFIGLVLICKGVCNAIGSYIFGGLVKYIGRLGCFIIAATLSYTAIIFMYLWDPLEDQMYILLIISAVWGIADAIWEPQVLGIVLFT